MKSIITAAITLGVALLRGIVSTEAHAQGMPVIDVANIAQAMRTVTQLRMQLEQELVLFRSLNGSRGMGDLFVNPALQNYLPKNWQSLYAAERNGGYAGLSSQGQAFRSQTAVFNCNGKTGDALLVCNHDLNKAAEDEVFGSGAYNAAQQRLAEIQGLTQQINAATDPKAIADLSARLQSESASIENEATKLQLFKMLSDSEDRLIVQQKHELGMKRAAATGTASQGMSPLNFQ